MKNLTFIFFFFGSLATAQTAKKPAMKNYVQSPIFVNDFYTDYSIDAKITQKGGVAVKGNPLNLFAEENAVVELRFEATDYEPVNKTLTMNLETLISDGLMVKMAKNFYSFDLKARSESGNPLSGLKFEVAETRFNKHVEVIESQVLLSPKSTYRIWVVADGHAAKELFIDPVSLLTKKLSQIEAVLAVETELKPFTNVEKGKSITLDNIFFDQGSAVLRSESFGQLELLYKFLKENPTMKIEIKGYTDDAGDFDMNIQLSKDRCQSVATFLTNNGIDKKRLKTVGRGPLEPVVPNTSEANRKRNRRVTFVVL